MREPAVTTPDADRTSARRNAGRDLRESHVGKGAKDQVGRTEVVVPGQRAWHRDAVDTGGLGRLDSIRRVLDGNGVAGGRTQTLHRSQVGVRCRLRPGHVLEAADTVPAAQVKTFQVARDPGPPGARGHSKADTHGDRFLPPLSDAGQDRQGLYQLPFAPSALGAESLPIQAAAQLPFQVGHGVEVVRTATDDRLPEVEREAEAVPLVDLCPGLVDGALSVDDQSVEIEDERAYPSHTEIVCGPDRHTAVAGSLLGVPMKRLEDPRLLTGGGHFVDDLRSWDGLHAIFVRSPLAHARLRGLDLSGALRSPGVVAAYGASDLDLPARLAFAVMPEVFARPPLAVDVVRFVGEAVAVVVGETLAAAADGAQAVLADFEPLPVAVTPAAAAAPGAPLLFPEQGSNLACEVAFGQELDALEGSDVVIRHRFVNQRLAAVPIEPNAILAAPDPETGGLQLWASTQSPFQLRDFVADCLGCRESEVRCTAPDVGGAFGGKLPVYPEQAVVAAVARRLGRPVRWIETRSGCFLAMNHGRGQVQDVELGATRDGRMTGLRVRIMADAGAYPGQGAFLPFYTGQMLSGPYQIPRIDFLARSYATNTTPTSAYRGAGRPEATALLERAVDLLAGELGLDPAEVRRRNFIPPDAFPYETAAGATYDSGNYREALERALEVVGYGQLRDEQQQRREERSTRLLGVGLGAYVEITAFGSPTEHASVTVAADGAVMAVAGTASQGQGHGTAYAQIVADTLGLNVGAVHVVEGDTGRVPRGDGTSSSRSMQLGGSAVLGAARALLERSRQLAAELLEASAEDLVVEDGRLGVRGVPGSGITWAELAAAAQDRDDRPLREEFDAFAEPSFPFGAHVAVVEVDVETGEVRLVRHVAVDDCGTVVNPTLVEGQVHGGVAQGAGQALLEEVVYDADGNLRTGSLLDYSVASAGELPLIESARTETPSPNNPLGAKGIGESGTIGATPAVQNAIVDALSHLGVRHLDMPVTSERIWEALRLSSSG